MKTQIFLALLLAFAMSYKLVYKADEITPEQLDSEKKGSVCRWLVTDGDGYCKQSWYESATIFNYQPGTCAEHGYTRRCENMMMEWWTKPDQPTKIGCGTTPEGVPCTQDWCAPGPDKALQN